MVHHRFGVFKNTIFSVQRSTLQILYFISVGFHELLYVDLRIPILNRIAFIILVVPISARRKL